MGSRQLRRWLNRPIRDHAELKRRQQAVDVLQRVGPVQALQAVLKDVGDLERILTRIGLKSARPRDLANLRDSLARLPDLRRLAAPLPAERLQTLAAHCGEHAAEQALLKRALVETPPVLLRDGGVIATGYDADLDELRRISTHADQYLTDLEARERDRLGLANLKVGYNRVHGFYIELTRGQAAGAPADYIRRQTLKGAERYVTPELKDVEDKVLSARERSLSREKQLYDELLDLLARDLGGLQRTAEAVAELDTLIDLAERAQALNLVLPSLVDSPTLEYRGGRHLGVEQSSSQPFVPNDLALSEHERMLIITGPNMGGKSTYMRQTALIAILAHIGSAVPAESATIGPIDRIFTRIGAADDLTGGRSTFMVVMTETANILNSATRSSLVLMDEVGRGTSTFDGLSLAWAAARHIAQRIGAFTLFATHYFELTTFPEKHAGAINLHVSAVESGGHDIVFLHEVQPGPASRSYGVQVARLAGMPAAIVRQARTALEALEAQQRSTQAQVDLFAAPPPVAVATPSPLEDALVDLDPDSLSPREALDALYRLKKLQQQANS
jgi:DNA mismatch repair protein MutS